MLNPDAEKTLNEVYVPKFAELIPDLKEYVHAKTWPKYRYSGDGAQERHNQYMASISPEIKVKLYIEENKDKYEYEVVVRFSVDIWSDNNIVCNLFSCVVRGTQYNCGMRQVTHLVAAGSYPGAGGRDKGSFEESIMSLGFDMLLTAMRGPNARYGYNTGYSCGILVMSHDADSFVTRVARRHPMWQEIGIANNPNYGGQKHEFVMFMADINGTRITQEESDEDEDEQGQ